MHRTRHPVRRTLEESLQTDEQLDAFLLDYFPEVRRELAAGMNRTQRLNELIGRVEDPALILEALEQAKRLNKLSLRSERLDLMLSVLREALDLRTEEPLPQPPAPTEPQDARPASPFRPFAWFGREDRALFFGRDLDTFDLAVRVRGQRLCVLHGASGTGKSSLIRAGLWPFLERDFVWFSHSPGPDFDASLRAALEKDWSAEPRPPGETLKPDPLGAFAQLAGGRPLLWVIDQAEELFTGCPPDQVSERALHVARLLREVRNRGDLTVHVLLGLRNDYLGHLELMKPELPDVFEHGQLLLPLDPTAAREALIEPFRTRGMTLTPALVLAVEKDLRDTERQTNPLELQLIGHDLYEHAGERRELDVDLYRSRGGAGRVLASYLSEALARLAKEEKDAGRPAEAAPNEARAILHALLGAEGLRAPAMPLTQLLPRLRLPEPTVRARLEWLVKARLIRSDHQPPAEPGTPPVATYRLAHDILAKELHASLSAEEKRDQDTLDDLRRRAATWDADGRPGLRLKREQAESFLAWTRGKEYVEPLVAAYLEQVRTQLRWAKVARVTLWIGLPLVLLLAAGFSYWAYQSSKESQAQYAEAQAERFLEKDPSQAMAWIAEAARLRGGFLKEPERNFDEHWLMAREAWDRGLGWVAMRHKQQVYKIVFTPLAPEGKDCPGCWPRRKLLASAGEDGQVLLYDLEHGGPAKPLCPEGPDAKAPCASHRGPALDLVFAPDGRWIASCGSDGAVRIWDPETRRLLHQYILISAEWSALAVSPDGEWLAAGSINHGPLLAWNARSFGKPLLLRGARSFIKRLAFASRRPGLLISAWDDGSLFVTDVATGNLSSLRPGLTIIEDLMFSPDGRWLAVSGYAPDGRHLVAFESLAPDAEPAWIREPGGGTISRLAWFSSGRGLLSADAVGGVQVHPWNEQVLHRKTNHTSAVTALAITSDEQWMASGDTDGGLRITHQHGTWQRRFAGHAGRVLSMTWTPDGRLLASSALDGTVRLWPRRFGMTFMNIGDTPIRSVSAQGDLALAGTDGGRLLLVREDELFSRELVKTTAPMRAICAVGDHWIAASEDGTMYSIIPPAEPEPLPPLREKVATLACAADGTRYTGHAKAVKKWRPGEAGPAQLGLQPDQVFDLALSSDGRRLVSVSMDGSATLWDLEGQKVLRNLKQDKALHAAAWLDERSIAIGGEDAQLWRWDVANGTRSPFGPPRAGMIGGLARSGDQHWLAVSGGDGLRLLSIRTEAQRPLASGTGSVSSVSFGKTRLYAGSGQGLIRSYPLPPTDRAAFAAWMKEYSPFLIENGKDVVDQPMPPLTDAFIGPIPPPRNPECHERCRKQFADGDLAEGVTLDDCFRACL